jgi:hypothetical protein
MKEKSYGDLCSITVHFAILHTGACYFANVKMISLLLVDTCGIFGKSEIILFATIH